MTHERRRRPSSRGARRASEVVPEMSRTLQVIYQGSNAQSTSSGTTPNYPAVRNFELAHGPLLHTPAKSRGAAAWPFSAAAVPTQLGALPRRGRRQADPHQGDVVRGDRRSRGEGAVRLVMNPDEQIVIPLEHRAVPAVRHRPAPLHRRAGARSPPHDRPGRWPRSSGSCAASTRSARDRRTTSRSATRWTCSTTCRSRTKIFTLSARRHRVGLAPGRRHRDHEHHAGLGDRADAGDRRAEGARRDRAARSCSSSSSRRSSSAFSAAPSASPSARSSRRSWPHARVAARDHHLVDRDLVRLLRGRRPLLRDLSGGKGLEARSDRGPPVRVGAPCGRPDLTVSRDRDSGRPQAAPTASRRWDRVGTACCGPFPVHGRPMGGPNLSRAQYNRRRRSTRPWPLAEPLARLIKSGVAFLHQLAAALPANPHGAETTRRRIEPRQDADGSMFLAVPLPSRDAVTQLADDLAALLRPVQP